MKLTKTYKGYRIVYEDAYDREDASPEDEWSAKIYPPGSDKYIFTWSEHSTNNLRRVLVFSRRIVTRHLEAKKWTPVWTSVEDKLPSDSRSVFVRDEIGIATANYFGKNPAAPGEWWANLQMLGELNYRLETPTHWMPIEAILNVRREQHVD